MTAAEAGGRRDRRGRVIAVDGPAASGKSTTARAVGRRLGYWHVNSGLLYRAITWIARERGWDEEDPGFGDRVRELEIGLGGSPEDPRVRIEGTELGRELHAPAVSERVSSVAARAPVRERVLALLRRAAATRDLVCDGRDIGTVVFPDAELKVFLTATAEERARRRLLDYGEEPRPERIAGEAARLRARDAADATRALAPLRKADDAVEVDTTRMSPEEVVERIVELAAERDLTAGGDGPDGPPTAGPDGARGARPRG